MIQQGTPEWRMLRAGKATASRIKDIIAKTKSGYSASRENYLIDLAMERLGAIDDGYINDAMQHGTELEPYARHAYEVYNNVMVDEIDFVPHPTIAMAGASPDGIIGEGLLEIKCPTKKTHIQYLLADAIPNEYKPQMAWQMACTGAKWCDFVSFDNRVLEGLQYFQIRYHRDNEYIAMLEKEVTEFLTEVDAKYQQLNELLLKKAA